MTYSIYTADGPHCGNAFVHNMHKHNATTYTKRVIMSVQD